MSPWQTTPNGIRLSIWAQPGAKKTAIAGLHGDFLKIQLAARPVEGAANADLLAFLAEALGVPKRAVTLVKGEQQRRKVVDVVGSPEQLDACLERLLNG